MMQQWPYGANILIECTSTNIPENIDIGGADFVTSRVKDTIMTFKYTEINGQLVSIDTNLEEVFRTRDSNTKTGQFKLKTINNGKTKDGEKPYINLCCNNVKIPLVFIDHTNDQNPPNKWGSYIIDNDTITLYGHNTQEAPYIKFAKEIVVNWDSTSTETIMKGMDKTGLYRESYLACEVYYLYLDKNKKLQNDITTIWSTGDGGLTGSSTWKVTIPRLDGKETSLVWNKNGTNNNISNSKKSYYKFFMLGVQVRMWDGYTADKFETLYFIGKDKNSINKTYDNTTFSEPITGIYYLESTNGFPDLTVTELKNKWNSDFFFTTQEKNGEKYYISPSTSEIYNTYFIENTQDCSCNIDCSCDCDIDCSKDCHCNAHWGCEGYTCGDNYDDRYSCECYEYCVCYEFIETSKKWECQGFYECQEYVYDECYLAECWLDALVCPCNKYYDHLINGKCETYCNCHTAESCPRDYCDCDTEEDECPTDGTSPTCPSHAEPSGGTITVPALRQLNGVWGADCTRRAYDTSMGIWKTFMYNGYFHTYP